MATMTRYTHQQKLLNTNPRVRLLAWSMGAGKTRGAIEWAVLNQYQTLIICPKGLVAQWHEQIEKWGQAVLFTVVSKETFKLQPQPKYAALIVDEADHFFSSHLKSQLSKSLATYIRRHDPALLLLTGTPYRSSAWNIYTAATFLGIFWNYRNFESAFFYSMRMGQRTILQPRKDLETTKKLKELIHKIADVVTLEECADIPQQVDEQVTLGLTDEQKALVKANPEVVPIARFTSDHKIEAEIGVKTPGFKLERIKRILEENGKVIVVCRYLEQMEAIQIGLGFQALRVDGSTKNRHKVIQEFEGASSAALIVQEALCEGWEAPSCSTMVFASMGFSYRNYVQMKARILRLNALHKNVYIHLLADKADRAILKAMKLNRDFDVLQDYEN